MTADDVLTALDLPPATAVDRRVPKTLLLENGAPTAADKRAIREGVERVRWVAAVKPTTAGVPAYRDGEREYLEVAVLRLTLREGARRGRLVELVHRAVPYPVVLVTEGPGGPSLSLAHKRAARREADRVVLDGDVEDVALGGDTPPDTRGAFLGALALSARPRPSLLDLYQHWTDAAVALRAARVVGRFTIPATPGHADARRTALADLSRIDAEIAAIRRSAAREKQVARRADLNLRLSHLRVDRQKAIALL